MSLQTIVIHRDFQIIDGFVQVPHNKETDKSRVTAEEALNAIAGSTESRLTVGSGRNRGWKAGVQSVLRLPGVAPGESYPTTLGQDPVETLANH